MQHSHHISKLARTRSVRSFTFLAGCAIGCGAADETGEEFAQNHSDLRWAAELEPVLDAEAFDPTLQFSDGSSDLSANPPAFGVLPGTFSIHTRLRDTYLTARDGGGRATDAIITTATTPAFFEKFKLETFQPDFVLLTAPGGQFVTALGQGGVGGGSDDTKTLQTQSTFLADDVLFRFDTVSDTGLQTIETYGGYFLTALGGGGKSTRAFHTDATVASTWEHFWVAKCGDLGSGYNYAIRPSGKDFAFGHFIHALGQGGRIVHAMAADASSSAEARFRLIRQADGSYALRTPNNVNYVTAVGGGGWAHGSASSDNLHTDATQALAWERFRIVDQGNCSYTIQTVSGFYLAASADGSISTRISDPNSAPSIGYNAQFELVMLGL
jgi:hypothetical protein